MKMPHDYLALALDNITSREKVRELIDAVKPSFGVFKVGLEQFTRFGPPILEEIAQAKRHVFLDLKFHDIPNTVAKAVLSVCELGAQYLTIHAMGGVAMMRAAAEAALNAAAAGMSPPRLIGVTLLTSIGDEILRDELGVVENAAGYARRLAKLAVEAGVDGIVCSAADLGMVKGVLPQGFEIITPGIRPAGAATHDQKRVATPSLAIEHGATLLVVGRAVTEAENPSEAAQGILSEVTLALGSHTAHH